ncbi:MAG: hypothetical protein U0974_12915 [Gemmatimonadales bacterium]|nr:hypothetical protein [Gemmatimonadales bacterium]
MKRIVLIGLLMIAGCDGDGDPLVTPAPPPPPPPTFTFAEQGWAGGPLAISSADFAADNTLPEIRIGGVVVPVSRSGDSVVIAVLPDTMAGPRQVTLVKGGETRVLGTVAVSGVTAVVDRSEVISIFTIGLPYPQDGAASMLTVVGGKLTLIDYDAGTATTLPAEHGFNGSFEPGPTFDPDVWLTRADAGAPVEVWRLRPVPVKLDEISILGSDSRLVLGMPAPDTVVMVPTRTVFRYARQPGGSWTQITAFPFIKAEGSQRLLISPSRDRWVFGAPQTFESTFSGPDEPIHFAVWRGVTERAFILPDVVSSHQYVFSPNGDELALIGGVGSTFNSSTGPWWLIVVDPANGTERLRRQLGGRGVGLAYDRTRPLLYVLTGEVSTADTVLTLEVIDRRNWQVVGRVRLPDNVSGITDMLVLPSSAGRVHVIGRQSLSSGTTAYTIGPVP